MTNNRGNRTTKSRKIRTLREMETDECLGIIEADTIKKAEMIEKNLKRILQENKKTTRNQTT